MTNEDIKHNFSENLIKLRKAKNLTQLQLAEKLNYSDKAISKWEVGSVLPDVETKCNSTPKFVNSTEKNATLLTRECCYLVVNLVILC